MEEVVVENFYILYTYNITHIIHINTHKKIKLNTYKNINTYNMHKT